MGLRELTEFHRWRVATFSGPRLRSINDPERGLYRMVGVSDRRVEKKRTIFANNDTKQPRTHPTFNHRKGKYNTIDNRKNIGVNVPPQTKHSRRRRLHGLVGDRSWSVSVTFSLDWSIRRGSFSRHESIRRACRMRSDRRCFPPPFSRMV